MTDKKATGTTEIARSGQQDDASSKASLLGKRPIRAKRVESCKYMVRR